MTIDSDIGYYFVGDLFTPFLDIDSSIMYMIWVGFGVLLWLRYGPLSYVL